MCCAVFFFSGNLCDSFLSLPAVTFLCIDRQPSWKTWALRGSQLHMCIDRRSKQQKRSAGLLSWGFSDLACCPLTNISRIRLVWNPSPVWLGQPLGAVGRPKCYWPFPLEKFWESEERPQLSLHMEGDMRDLTSSTCMHARVSAAVVLPADYLCTVMCFMVSFICLPSWIPGSWQELPQALWSWTRYFDFMYMVLFSTLPSEIKQSIISHGNPHGFKDAGVLSIPKSPSAFSQLLESIYPSLASQDFSLGCKLQVSGHGCMAQNRRRVLFTVCTGTLITWRLIFFEGNGSCHVSVGRPKTWRKPGILNLVVDCVHECPTTYLRVEEFSLDEGLPDAVDVIDANHTSLTSRRTIFLDFD